MTINGSVIRSTLVGALGGLLFGFDTAVISGTTHALTLTYHLTHVLLGVTVSSALVGTVVGALTAAIPGQKYGRRDSLRVMAIFYVISALGCAFAWNWPALIFFRFIGGLGIGGSSFFGPVYCRNCSSQVAWPPGRKLPGQHCCRHPAGLSFKLSDRPTTARRGRMALAARQLCHSGVLFSYSPVRDSAQSTMAGHAVKSERSAARSSTDWSRASAATTGRNCRLHPSGTFFAHRPTLLAAISFSRVPRHHSGNVQPAVGNQCDSLLPE